MHSYLGKNTSITVPSGGFEVLFTAPHRFSFNGQERTDEIAGMGNHTTALYWEYDTRLGRRWNLDPIYNTDISRYTVNGNNSIYYLDPNGDFKTKFGAKVYNFLHGGKGEVKQAGTGDKMHAGEWYVGKGVKYEGEGVGVAYERKFGWDKGNPANAIDDVADGLNKGVDFAKRNASDAWNSPLARYYIPDYYTYSRSIQTSSGIYMNEELTFTLMLRGRDPGLYINTTTGFGVVTSVGVDVGCSVGKGYYYDSNPRELSSSMLGGWQGSLSTAFGARGTVVQVGGTAGVDVGLNDKNEISTVTTKVGISVGVGVGTPILQGGIGAGKATNAIPIFKF